MKTTEEMIAVMQAYVNGKRIECKGISRTEWFSVDNPFWNWLDYDYRVEPERE